LKEGCDWEILAPENPPPAVVNAEEQVPEPAKV
jgi:hypothetical protein